MAVPKNNCCSDLLLQLFTAIVIPPSFVWILRFTREPGAIPISNAGPVPVPIAFTFVDGLLDATKVQNKINADATYMSSGVTITVNSITEAGLSLTVCQPTTVALTGSIKVTFDVVAS